MPPRLWLAEEAIAGEDKNNDEEQDSTNDRPDEPGVHPAAPDTGGPRHRPIRPPFSVVTELETMAEVHLFRALVLKAVRNIFIYFVDCFVYDSWF